MSVISSKELILEHKSTLGSKMVQYIVQAFWHIYGICADGVDKISATQFFLNGKQEYTLTKGLSFLNFPTTHILFYLMIFCFTAMRVRPNRRLLSLAQSQKLSKTTPVVLTNVILTLCLFKVLFGPTNWHFSSVYLVIVQGVDLPSKLYAQALCLFLFACGFCKHTLA